MALKIISGYARGITLDTPEGRSMRPTSGKAREALFSSLGSLEGANFADVFAGSGAIGLEAASRGAASVTLLEANAQHVRIIERNLGKVRRAGVECEVNILRRNVTAGALLSLPAMDVVFFDPPYADSARYFLEFIENKELLAHWRKTLIVWELPDTAEAAAGFQKALAADSPLDAEIRTLGGVPFLRSYVKL